MMLNYLLVGLVVMFPLTILISYLVGVGLGHIPAAFPYISDTAAYLPESCIFGQMLNICALLFGLLIYFRHLLVAKYFEKYQFKYLAVLNYMSTTFGIISAFGVSMVANFQETRLFAVHVISAFVTFSFAGLFMITQTLIAFRTSPLCVSKFVAILRGALAILFSTAFVLTTVFGKYASYYFSGSTETKWKPEDGGWNIHIVSAATEWLMAFLIVIFMATYRDEFRLVCVKLPSVEVHTEEPESYPIDPYRSLMDN